MFFSVFFPDFPLSNPSSRPASACSMVSALIVSDQGQEGCPVCGCFYDSGKQRKLVDTNCGHARCFKCMFAVEQCPLCHGGHGGQSDVLRLHQPKQQSCISRESGFQSFNGSVSSVYSTTGKRCPRKEIGIRNRIRLSFCENHKVALVLADFIIDKCRNYKLEASWKCLTSNILYRYQTSK